MQENYHRNSDTKVPIPVWLFPILKKIQMLHSNVIIIKFNILAAKWHIDILVAITAFITLKHY
jgi:hypothetical protein